MSGPVKNSDIQDAGLRCPQCDYNLTGLPEPRCPECGATFDWKELQRAANPDPTIAFERARGWRKVPAFVVTWATVLFVPWIFARQIVKRVSTAHGIAFLAVCYACVSVVLCALWLDFPYWATWLATATICIVLQAVGLTIIDPHGWRAPLPAVRFWLLVGCYTSAVMVTECYGGPHYHETSELLECIETLCEGRLQSSDVYKLMDQDRPWGWAQIILWLVAVACCYAARLRRRRLAPTLVVVAVMFATLAVFTLYTLCMLHIGPQLWGFYDGSIF